LAEQVLESICSPQTYAREVSVAEAAICDAWPRPQVAPLPWDLPRAWLSNDDLSYQNRRKAA
jgi:hypothetical protein